MSIKYSDFGYDLHIVNSLAEALITDFNLFMDVIYLIFNSVIGAAAH